MKSRLLIAILMIAALVGCKRGDSVIEQINSEIVVNAVLDINKPIDSVVLSRLNPLNDNLSLEDIDVDVRLLVDDSEYILDELSAGVYGLNDASITVLPNHEYELIIHSGDETLHAKTITPHDHMGYTITKSEINTNQLGDQVDITFTEEYGNDVFYLVKIIPLDETLLPVVVVNPSNNNEREFFVYNGDNNIISILGSYFSYIGEHNIEIYRINEEFLPLFGNAVGPNQITASGNITNGLGSFVGMERISVEISVQ